MSSGVEFEEDKFAMSSKPQPGSVGSYNGPVGQSNSKMVRWLIAKGIVKSPRVGEILLFVIVIVNAIITYIVVTKFF